MKQLLVKKGEVVLEEVPAPTVDENSVLVKVRYSLISIGTEISGITSSGESLLRKAIKQPEKVKKALEMIKNQGFSKTFERVKGELGWGHPIGYSCTGVVIDVGKNVQDIKIGDKVACAGAGKANHAEIVCVPRNLVVKVPDNLDLREAASVTIGAIAMQGVRRADPRFGEIVAIIGLGLIGQLTVQILKAAGCHVIGIDVIKSRVELAKNLGMDYGVVSGEEDPVDSVLRYSSGYGADATIIAAATKSDLPVQQSLEMTRKKGKVVVLGDVGLHLKREPFYERELDFLISRSYGPGRYDGTYEEKGIDYPYPYVRWTENRNMQEYLRMLAEGKVTFKALISREYSIKDAPKAYQELKESKDRPLGVLLKYGMEHEPQGQKLASKIVVSPRAMKRTGVINVAVVGAGSFAKSVHLPNLRRLSNLYNIYAIVSRTGSNAKEVAKRFGANYCTTDYQESLEDENVDIVLITTRHNLHAKMAIEAAKAGKAIFLEKPMALNKKELDELVKTLERTRIPFMVGFNRRFSPFAVRAKEVTSKRINPMIINYRVNAGYIPLNHWAHTEEGGGRVIGEACHIFDLFNYFTDSEVESIDVNSITPKTLNISSQDNFTTTLKYSDGSICTLTYTALGANELGKEYIEIYIDDKVLVIDDFKALKVYGSKEKGMRSRGIQKGHLEELIEFTKCIKGEAGLPIPMEQLISATKTSFLVDEVIRKV